MARYLLIALLLVTVTLLALQPAAAAQNDWKLVVRVKGTVQSQKSGDANWVGIWQSRMLQNGDKARTLDASRANIRLADQSVVTLGANTVVAMEQFSMTPQSRTAVINLVSGRIRANVGRFTGQQSRFQVTTPNAVLAARGTEFFVEQDKVTRQGGGNLTLLVFSGTVNVTAGGNTFTLYPGWSMTFTPAGGFVVNPPGQAPAPVTGGISGGGGGDTDMNQPPPGVDIQPSPDAQILYFRSADSGGGDQGSTQGNNIYNPPAPPVPNPPVTTGNLPICIQ